MMKQLEVSWACPSPFDHQILVLKADKLEYAWLAIHMRDYLQDDARHAERLSGLIQIHLTMLVSHRRPGNQTAAVFQRAHQGVVSGR